MINDTISSLEEKIRNAELLKNNNKEELLKLISNLKEEIAKISGTHTEDAVSIADFTAISTKESIRKNKNSKLIDLSIEGMRTSVKKFEVSHPDLVETVNSICNYLSNLGI
jgi:hypothetical protein